MQVQWLAFMFIGMNTSFAVADDSKLIVDGEIRSPLLGAGVVSGGKNIVVLFLNVSASVVVNA
ncbi:hypothetical protein PF005_g6527 [Phytophthora fragariae]|uniref:Pectate lyase n=1 Tax=Phytophthora fragariae TaxID=53985 RepID=A0A6A3YPW0_9STRA|nr:hypothetical protein PF003_g27911 [Phytophthora fragariae]KAE8944340.1 hypothetical protein PF009_g5981 [Phytophthora fragariae]KAE9020445.1 hypothetical protein PF011_g5401 [Phytophthora fragariae]KAE9124952.1 hypothetical protein PF010_g5807 [Phytophthora fragariae]KAE9127291.1 hypothetical protein PF007_g5654 [Phytophthora fragariae]